MLTTYLEKEGYEVHTEADGQAGLQAIHKFLPDVIVLDVMLPTMDGLNVCQQARRKYATPILMMSARDDDVDKILGLEIGADDYITKPFNPKELVARVRAIFRRLKMTTASPFSEDEIMVRKNIKIYVPGQKVEVDGHEVALTPIEFSLLRVLAAHVGRVMSRQELLDKIWGPEFDGDERTVDAHVRNLRHKLQKATPGPNYITAVWRAGYKLDE